MDNPYLRYLNSDFDEKELMQKSHELLVAGKVDDAIRNAMKIEAVKFVKQSLFKVEKENPQV